MEVSVMKVKISVLALIAMLFLGLTAANALAANSFNFLGQATWTVTINEDETGPITRPSITMTGAISKLGPNYYLFQGVVPVPDDNPFFLAGAGTLVTLPGGTNPTLVLTLNTSQLHTDSDRDTGVMHVEINPSDLSGTFYEVGHDFDTNNRPNGFSETYTAGTLGAAVPPINLNPGSLAPLSSLLLE
jgi:hypothetical protein